MHDNSLSPGAQGVDMHSENTTGNLSNNGYAVQHDGRIYFCGSWDESGGAVYSQNLDGSDMRKLSDDPAININAHGDRIFYTLMDYAKGEFGIVSIRTNGTNRRMIFNDVALHVTIVDNSIYFYSDDMETVIDSECFFDCGSGGIYTMNTDGSGLRKLSASDASGMAVVDGHIYYSAQEFDCFSCEAITEGGIYVMKTDGSDLRKLSDDSSYCLNVVDDYIYYINKSDNFRIYAMKTDGSDRYGFSPDRVHTINVAGDLIYFSNGNDGYEIYTIKIDDTDERKLSDYSAFEINIVGDLIFANEWPDWVNILIIRIDGSEL